MGGLSLSGCLTLGLSPRGGGGAPTPTPSPSALTTPVLSDSTGDPEDPADTTPHYSVNFVDAYPDGASFDDILHGRWGTSEAAAIALTPVEVVIDESWVVDGTAPFPTLDTFAEAQADGATVHYQVKVEPGAHRTGGNVRTDSAWSNFRTFTVPTALVAGRLIVEGDSISGAGPAGYNYLYDTNFPAVDYNKLAVGGSTIGASSATVPSLLNRQATALALNAEAMTVFIGANDVNNTSRYPTVQNWYDALVAYIAPFRAAGTKVAVMTVIQQFDNAAFNTRATTANTLIRAGEGTDFDYVIEFGADAVMGIGGTATLADYTETSGIGVHPSQARHADRLYPLFKPAAHFLIGLTNEVNAFTLTDAVDVVASTRTSMGTGTVSGLYIETKAFTVTNGVLVKNGAGGDLTSGTLAQGDTWEVFATSDPDAGDSITVTLTIGTVSDSANISTVGGSAYTAQSVRFDGADRLARGAALTGIVAGKQGMFSTWVNFQDDVAAAEQIIGRTASSNVRMSRRSSDKKIEIFGYSVAPAVILTMRTVSTFPSTRGWAHILASWDLATGRAQLYVDGVADLDAAFTVATNDDLNYATPDYGVGATTLATDFLNAELADVYFNSAASLDLTTSGNRDKFILAGNPVDLGADGSTPTGTAPIVYLSGAVASWHTNKGTGGGFTVTGALVAGATNP